MTDTPNVFSDFPGDEVTATACRSCGADAATCKHHSHAWGNAEPCETCGNEDAYVCGDCGAEKCHVCERNAP